MGIHKEIQFSQKIIVVQGQTCGPRVFPILGQDFEATFSLVMWMDSLWTLLAITTVQDLEIGQMDIKGMYLNGNLKEEIYMWQPEGFNDQSGKL